MARRSVLPIVIGVALVAATIAMLRDSNDAPAPRSTLRVAEIMSDDGAGFAQADRVRAFDFPTDHGPHHRFRNEWWYFTGNLRTASGRAFGYQLTFFRTALSPDDPERESRWGTNHVYMAHATVSDIEAERFHAFERISRGALGLAGAQARPAFRVWLEDWSAEGGPEQPFPMQLSAREGEVAFTLQLREEKPMVLQGDRGLSAKSEGEGHASYYYSYTRIATHGAIEIDGETFEVEGESWLDREWGSSALGRNQVGWDWFAIQLDDGTDVMIAQVRAGGGEAPFRGGSIVSPEGRIETIEGSAIELDVLDHWQSRLTQARYPSRWRLSVRQRELALEVTPAFAAQELPVSILYWEGATRIEGTHRGRAVRGVGYTELTGYADFAAAEARQAQR